MRLSVLVVALPLLSEPNKVFTLHVNMLISTSINHGHHVLRQDSHAKTPTIMQQLRGL